VGRGRALLAGMHIGLLPRSAQDMVWAEPVPSPEILLGYWNDLLVIPGPELTQRWTNDPGILRSDRVPYWVCREGRTARRLRGLADVDAPRRKDHRLPGNRALPPARRTRRGGLPANDL
jgi:hypothetical protein